MKKLLLLSTLLIFGFNLSSQEVYFKLGLNHTKLEDSYLQNNFLTNDSYNPENGASFELGYVFPTRSSKFGVTAGLTLDQFNVSYSYYESSNLNLKTNFLGLQGIAKYKLFNPEQYPFSVNINAGLNFNHIISGKREYNTIGFVSDDIKREFKGFYIMPKVGLDINFFILDNITFELAYNYAKSIQLYYGNRKKFTNSQIQLGILISI